MTNDKSIFFSGVSNVINYFKYIALALFLLFVGLAILPTLGSMLFVEIVGQIDPTYLYSLMIVGSIAVGGWTGYTQIFVLIWPYLAFILWAVMDSRKFKAKGISTRPYLWGLGMIFPLILIVFPLYIIRRNITWVKTPTIEGLEVIVGDNEIPKKKRSWTRVAIIALVVIFVVLPLLSYLLLQAGKRNRALGDFLINVSLANSCGPSKSGCDELAPLPKVLQNKKIIFNEDVSVEFDPRQESGIEFNDLDVLGFLNTTLNEPIGQNIVDPKLGERGLLSEKEYKIVRAVRHYRCSYCVDGGDLAYIVLEDSKGNRFEDMLNGTDASVSPGADIPWDEQLPYSLWDGEFGRLVDI